MEIKTKEDAIKIANEIERFESAVKKMKDELKEYVTANGPVDTGENVWSFSESVSWDFPPDKLKELAAEILMMGQNPWAHLDLGSRSINKLGLSESVLKQYGSPKVTKRFASRKSEKKAVAI